MNGDDVTRPIDPGSEPDPTEPTTPVRPPALPPPPSGPPDAQSSLHVVAVDPPHGTNDADPGGAITARFSQALDGRTLTGAAFRLFRQGTDVPIPANLAYDPQTMTAALRPESDLERSAAYTAVMRGGPPGVTALSGLEMREDVSWSFTTRRGLPRWVWIVAAIVVLAIVGVVLGLLLSGGDDSPTVQPEAIDFGEQALGARSAAQQVTVTNRAKDALSILSVSFAGADQGDFVRVGGTCVTGTSLAKDASCVAPVSFSPTKEGERSATMSIATSNGSPLTVSLSGTGTGRAVASASADALSFGSVTPGGPSATQQASVTNGGNVPLSIRSVTVTGPDAADFKLASATTCTPGKQVPAEGRCVVVVTFAPTGTGDRTATVEIEHGAPGSPLAISLSGTGASRPEAELAPGSADLGDADVGKTSRATTFTVTNSGTADLSLSSISFTGESPRSFVVTGTGTCRAGATLKIGSTCTVTVAFAPLGAGSVSATLVVAADGTHATAAVTGTGNAPPPTTTTGTSATSPGAVTPPGSTTQPAP